MRTFVYVDGFNLYYGALRGTPWKWLDLPDLFAKVLQPRHDILKVKYFTARVSGTAANPSKPLMVHADFARHVRPGALRQSQLPDPIPGTSIRKPARW